MEISVIFLWSILLFFIITIAVRLAINPLINKEAEIISESEDSGLAKLRDIGVLNNSELDEIILPMNLKNITVSMLMMILLKKCFLTMSKSSKK